MNHERRAVAMTQINYFDAHPLLAQGHRHRREDKSSLRVARQKGLFEFRKTVKPHRFKYPVPRHACVDEVGDGTCEVSGNRQKANPKLRLPLARGAEGKPIHLKIEPRVQNGDGDDPSKGRDDNDAFQG
jgi:hypothetical protein